MRPQKGSILEEFDENRIDWERKRKVKRTDVEDEPEVLEDDHKLDVLVPKAKPGKQQSRKKRRQLVYDEDRGQVIVKRKRRRLQQDWEDWDDDF